MISTILFALSAICFGAMFSPREPSRSTRQPVSAYTYYVCDNEPMPTWKRKRAPKTRVADMVG